MAASVIGIREVKIFLVVRLTILALAVAVLTVVFVPREGKTITVQAIPGNHVIVPEILDGDMMLTETQFRQFASQGYKVYVSHSDQAITYRIRHEDGSVRYNQPVLSEWGWYNLGGPTGIKDGFITVPTHIKYALVILVDVVACIVVLILLGVIRSELSLHRREQRRWVW